MNMNNEQLDAEKFWDRISLGKQVIGTVEGITFIRDLSDYDDSPWFNQSGYIDVFATAEDAAFINEAFIEKYDLNRDTRRNFITEVELGENVTYFKVHARDKAPSILCYCQTREDAEAVLGAMEAVLTTLKTTE